MVMNELERTLTQLVALAEHDPDRACRQFDVLVAFQLLRESSSASVRTTFRMAMAARDWLSQPGRISPNGRRASTESFGAAAEGSVGSSIIRTAEGRHRAVYVRWVSEAIGQTCPRAGWFRSSSR